MAFPSIDETKPVGTQMVSDIDDAERETRAWLKQCIKQVSGYPDIATVTVAGWTTAGRPSSNPNEGYLLGYNTTTSSLELIGANGNAIEVLSDAIKKSIALLAHPVGEYYWTSNASFNPATAWGGTWERIQDGRVLISNNGSHAVGSTGGVETVTLTLDQIPKYTHKHTHQRGTMNITGYIDATADTNELLFFAESLTYGGALTVSKTSSKHGGGEVDQGYNRIDFDASRAWTGSTTEDSFSFGGGQSHTNMQPYRTAICWHRTA